jgi:hypothetical protein
MQGIIHFWRFLCGFAIEVALNRKRQSKLGKTGFQIEEKRDDTLEMVRRISGVTDHHQYQTRASLPSVRAFPSCGTLQRKH